MRGEVSTEEFLTHWYDQDINPVNLSERILPVLVVVEGRLRMQRWINLIEVNCEPTREEEFNDWYDHVHVPDVLETPGFIGARRYVMKEFRDGRGKYLTVYYIETDDIDRTMEVRLAKREEETRLGRSSVARGRLTIPVWRDVLWKEIVDQVAPTPAKASSQKWVNLVEVNCNPSREDYFHEWYDTIHLPDVLITPGFVGARRYVIKEFRDGRGKYLAIYNIEADDIEQTMKVRLERRETEKKLGRSSGPPNSVVRPFWRDVLWRQLSEHVVPGKSGTSSPLPR